MRNRNPIRERGETVMGICQQPHPFYWRSLAVSDPEKRVVALESCVQTEDVTDLKGGAVVHHEVATDNNVYVVWRRRRKHRFQLARARLHLLLQTRRQSSIHGQLAR